MSHWKSASDRMSLKSIRCGSIVLSILLFAQSYGIAVRASSNSELNCEETDHKPLSYFCRPKGNSKIFGVGLGMNEAQAFRALCSASGEVHWAVRLAAPRTPLGSSSERYTPVTRGIICSNWSTFKKSDYWILRSQGSPCESDRFVFIGIDGSKISSLSIGCRQLAPK